MLNPLRCRRSRAQSGASDCAAICTPIGALTGAPACEPAGRPALDPACGPTRSRRLGARWLGQRWPAAALALTGCALAASAEGGWTAELPASPRVPRPADLVILLRSQSVNGEREVGVFGARADPQRPGLWSVQVWEETDDRVTIATDRIGCNAGAPMRITGSDRQLLVRELNPGGAIHPANRLDHLIWWAVCHPSQAGRDPAGLTAEARRLGYSTQLQETQQQLRAPQPPRP